MAFWEIFEMLARDGDFDTKMASRYGKKNEREGAKDSQKEEGASKFEF